MSLQSDVLLDKEHEVSIGQSYIQYGWWPELMDMMDSLRWADKDDVADYLFVEAQKERDFREFYLTYRRNTEDPS